MGNAVQEVHRRFEISQTDAHRLPLSVESVGCHPLQEKTVRPGGYPQYHWLQTETGQGEIRFEDKTYVLPPNTGVLLLPGVPHAYESTGERWRTAYLTFGGPAAESILASAGITGSSAFAWERGAPHAGMIEAAVNRLETTGDVFGLEVSSDAYRFLITLVRYATEYGKPSGSPGRHDKLRMLVEWMETRYADPGVGLDDIADVLQVSNRRLNALFHEAFGLSPYAYFIRLRIRKAKELLVRSTSLTVREVAERVGFRDASHFVATFRKTVGMPPEQYRKLH